MPGPGGICSQGGIWGVPGPGGCLVGGAPGRPPRDAYCCGRYASYWNAFLLLLILVRKVTTMCCVGHERLQKLKYIYKLYRVLLHLEGGFCYEKCLFGFYATNANTFPDGQMVLGGVGGSPCLSVMSIHSTNCGPLSSF